MIGWLKRVWARLFPAPPVIPAPVRTNRVKGLKPSAPLEGAPQFYFREDILDRLESYFVYMERMKRADRDAYDLFGRVGAWIGADAGAAHTDTSTAWKTTKPAFAATAFPPNEAMPDKNFHLKLAYMMKVDTPPPGVERTNHPTVYRVVFYYDDVTDKKLLAFRRGLAESFYVGVDDDGVAHLLRQANRHMETIRSRKGAFAVPRMHVGAPRMLVELAKDREETPGELAQRFFGWLYNNSIQQSGGIRIAVKKGALACAFSIDMLRTPYFFKDRDVILNENGNRTRIFHIVRTHRRVDGKLVKTHFRGARRFIWNGYAINITVPDFHHADLLRFNATEHDEEREDGMTATEAGQLLSKAIDQ